MTQGRFVEIEDTIDGFSDIIEGKVDDLSESAFFMVGPLDEAREKAEMMKGRRKNGV